MDWAQCQTWSIYNQLRAGIRYLDIRINFNDMSTHHGKAKLQPLKPILL